MPDAARQRLTRYLQHLLVSCGVLITALYALGVELPPNVQSVAAKGAPSPSAGSAAPVALDDAAAVVGARGSLSTRTRAASVTPLPTPVPVNSETPLFVGPQNAWGRGGLALAFPVPGGSISQSFRSGHEGIDIAAAPGVPVIAAASGRVLAAGWRNNGGGLVVEIIHPGGLTTAYNHLGSISVVAGQALVSGAIIGTLGCTGVCYGPHIQFDVRIDGHLIDPSESF